MMKNTIGVFDSGVGGLTVLKELRKKLKNKNFVYFGDTARVPYGSRSPSTIVKYSIENAELLLRYDIEILVVACNTSSSYAIPALKSKLKIPVIGVVEPGAETAVKMTRNKKIGVIGTEATIKSGSYPKAIKKIAKDIKVFQKSCPLLVPLIEEGLIEDEITYEVLRRYITPLVSEGIDTLLLGCTHYPLLKKPLKKLFPELILVDSATAVANKVKMFVSPNSGEGSLKILVSDKTEKFEKIARMIMEEEVEVEEVRIEKEISCRL
jgi:glutamate racemase